MNWLRTVTCVGIVGLLAGVQPVQGAIFQFGTGHTQNTISGLEQTVLVDEGVEMSLQAGPIGSRFNDSDPQGLGINSNNTSAGINDPDQNKFNFITGHPTGTRVAESFTFSFNQPGILQDLLLDGVKDETLEYFVINFPNRNVLTIFDSQADFRLGVQGFSLGDLNVVNPIECQTENDDLTGINYAFAAGEIFTLTYGEGDYDDVPGYKTNPNFPQFPNAVGDGARFQGVVIEVVPEPTRGLMLLVAAGLCVCRNRSAAITRQ
ncbi:MAG: hypothetical protein SH868_01670 [Bythopirellula sp.]|nr:hypothetical protein [Bythopirellula sp.]